MYWIIGLVLKLTTMEDQAVAYSWRLYAWYGTILTTVIYKIVSLKRDSNLIKRIIEQIL